MNNNESDDYDKSAFFRLLQSAKYRTKFEFVQEQQGLVVCPLRFRLVGGQSNVEVADIVDRHLFLPSPFYKSRYIPLVSLLALSQLNSSNSVPLDHSPKINLILSNDQDEEATDSSSSSNELLLMNGRKRICKNVKLISTQLAYSASFKVYKILIVNRPLSFKRPVVVNQRYVNNNNNSDDDDDNDDAAGDYDDQGAIEEQQERENEDSFENEYDAILDSPDRARSNSSVRTRSGSMAQQQQQQRARRSGFIPAISHRNSTFMRPSAFRTISDIRTYGKSIEFMHDTVALVNVNDDEDDGTSDAEEYDADDAAYEDLSGRRASYAPGKKKKKKKSPKFAETVLGDRLIQEVDLFRKTYIILSTHMSDCSAHLERIYKRYVKKFLKSFAMFTGGASGLASEDTSGGANSNNVELMVAIACENAIVGYVYTKIWPAILKLNQELDATVNLKCRQLVYFLKLDGFQDETSPRAVPADKLASVSAFFQLEPQYFLFNSKPMLKELSRLPFHNNPFEKLQCIKNSLDLLTNELTLSMATANAQQQQQPASTTQSRAVNQSSMYLTSETLIPLLAYMLVRSKIDCLHSIVYFIDNFQFSSRQEDDSSVTNTSHSTFLAELSYFMTTFKASIDFIENLDLD